MLNELNRKFDKRWAVRAAATDGMGNELLGRVGNKRKEGKEMKLSKSDDFLLCHISVDCSCMLCVLIKN